ncbi:MAG: aryl-sulfate sulfotransferase [Chitinophagales bacterium]
MRYFIFFILIYAAAFSYAQTTNSKDEEGYILFSPITNKNVYLIDKCGNLINSWQTDRIPGQATYLLENGSLIRAGHDLSPFYNIGGKGGYIEQFDWYNNKIWSFKLSDYDNCLHHDFKVLKNGNILALVWSEVRPLTKVIEMGRNPALNSTWVLTEKVVEIQPLGKDSGKIIWEWDLFDHLIQDFDSTKSNYGIIRNHPELVNINYVQEIAPNWVHINSIDYNENLDQILLSARLFSEIWVIDHSTTSVEAKGHTGGKYGRGGDLLYRWGNTRAYNRGDTTNQQFFFQHDAKWIKSGFKHEGKILVFNNGLNRPDGKYSTINIISPPININTHTYSIDNINPFLPVKPDWTYKLPTEFYSSYLSGVQPLKNGGYLICSGTNGIFFEIDSLQHKVWEYTNAVIPFGVKTIADSSKNNNVYKCSFYYPDFRGFKGKNLKEE